MKVTSWRRAAALGLVAVAALAAFLAAKWALVYAFVLAPWLPWLAALAAVAVVAGAALPLRVGPGPATAITLALAVVLAVDVVESPLAYEIERAAVLLPHPDGATQQASTADRAFTMGHPRAYVRWAYPDGSNLTALTDASASALRSGGWDVTGVTRPGGALGPFGLVEARRGPFLASCTVGEESGVAVMCALTV